MDGHYTVIDQALYVKEQHHFLTRLLYMIPDYGFTVRVYGAYTKVYSNNIWQL